MVIANELYKWPWFLLLGILGKEGIAGFERAGEAEILDTRTLCKAASNHHIKMHADSCSCSVSDSGKED